jgi:hypothetical protein
VWQSCGEEKERRPERKGEVKITVTLLFSGIPLIGSEVAESSSSFGSNNVILIGFMTGFGAKK